MEQSNTMETFVIDACGTPGAPGSDGDEGRGRYGIADNNGESGFPGGDAGGAGRIEVSATLGQNQELELRGSLLDPKRKPAESTRLDRALDVSKLGLLRLLARGGIGGRGGNGGKGGRGASGSPGADASRYSSGSDGGRGGTGGDGGNAAPGGDGGPGGAVTVNLAGQDLDLALLFDWDVSGGLPGQPGQPGQGGAGGSGGRGGSSYSWTETESYTDAQGNSQTRSISKSNSGGSDGPSGYPGSPGGSAAAGSLGQAGRFELKVDQVSFPDRYRLKNTGYAVVSSQKDRLLEFGEKNNRVENVRLGNVSAAPSPPANLELQLRARQGVLPHDVRVPVPQLSSGQNLDLNGLIFDLEEAPDELLPAQHERLRVSVWIEPEVYFTRLSRFAPEAANPRELEVTFPVELETLYSPGSLMPGQTIQQRWVVRNLSSYEFPTPGRKLTVELCNPAGDGNLRVLDLNGEPLDLGPRPTTYLEIEPLPPGGERVVTVYLSFAAGTPPYAAVDIWAALRLTPRYGGEPREIQRNTVSFTAAQAHRGGSSDVLLVTHAGSRTEEVREWGDLLSRLGLIWDVWDAAWHGDFPILQLTPDIAGKLVVILNTPFSTPDRQSIHPTDLLPLPEFREAVSKHGISFYLLGSASELCHSLIPLNGEYRQFSSVGDYLDSFEPRSGSNPEVPETMSQHIDQVAITRFHVAADPKPADLAAEAEKLITTLRKRFPDRRFAVSSHFHPDAASGWFRKRCYGFLRVRQLPDADARAVVIREVYRKTGQKASFVRSTENLLGLFSAMDFDDKLALAKGLDESRRFAVEPLADAWLLDLGEEQMVLRRSEVHTGKRRIRELLNRTSELCRYDFRRGAESLEVESPLGQVVVRMAAGLSFLAKARLHWSDHRVRLFGGTNEVEISEVVDDLVDQMLDTNFGADPVFGKSPKARAQANALIEARREGLDSLALELENMAAGELGRKDSAVEALVRWDLRDYLECDSSLASGLYSEQRLAELETREREAADQRLGLLKMFRQATAAGALPADAPFQEHSPA